MSFITTDHNVIHNQLDFVLINGNAKTANIINIAVRNDRNTNSVCAKKTNAEVSNSSSRIKKLKIRQSNCYGASDLK